MIPKLHHLYRLLLLCTVILTVCGDVSIISKWLEDDNRKMNIKVSLTAQCDLSNWAVDLEFGRKVIDFEAWSVHHNCNNKMSCRVTNVEWNGDVQSGHTHSFDFIVTFKRRSTPPVTAKWAPNLCSADSSDSGENDAPSGFVDTHIVSKWLKNGQDRKMKVKVSLTAPCDLSTWQLELEFGRQTIDFATWNVLHDCKNKQKCLVSNKPHNGNMKAGETLSFEYIATFSGTEVPSVSANLGPGICNGVPTSTPKVTTTQPTNSPLPTLSSSTTTMKSTTTSTVSHNGILHDSDWLEGGDRKVSAKVNLQALCHMTSWSVVLTFSDPPDTFETWEANNGDRCIGQLECTLTNKYSNTLQQGDMLEFLFQAKFDMLYMPQISAKWDASVCSGEPPVAQSTAPTTVKPSTTTSVSGSSTSTKTPESTPPPSPGDAKYNYAEVLSKSILFYEAQRSGKLPSNNRIPWRKDSALNDGSDVGHNLMGGWYDAGDYVKFNFPMASSVTLLAWGMLRYKQGYVYAGEWENALDSIKWPLDYLLKCHTSVNEFYGQVGNGGIDHAYWGRPEDMTMARPAYKLTNGKPGSDLAGEAAAAMAASYLVFKDSSPSYAATLLSHSKALYTFAKTYKGKYSDSIPDASIYYRSYGYNDELAWAAIWLHKATGEASYLTEAKTYLSQTSSPQELSWDDKGIGASLLIYEAASDAASKQKIEFFVDYWLHKVKRTPKGLAWLRQWGPNRYAANAAFAMQVAADLGFHPAACQQFAENQINYLLGDGGRSYVVGFGNNPPQRPHHSSSSCPSAPAPCNWNTYNSPEPNAHTLFGALVGGPGDIDDYEDIRQDYIKNEVACDYNSGFQSAVTGVLEMYMTKK